MSQEKVDRYKEQKANRKTILKRQKRKILVAKVASSIVAIVIIGWIGHAAYQSITDTTGQTINVNMDSINHYMSSLST